MSSDGNGTTGALLLDSDILLLSVIAQIPRDSLDTISKSTSIVHGRKFNRLHSFCDLFLFSFFLFLVLDLISIWTFCPFPQLVFKTSNQRNKAFYGLIFLGFPHWMSIFVYLHTWHSRGDGPTVGEAHSPQWAQPCDLSLGNRGAASGTGVNEERERHLHSCGVMDTPSLSAASLPRCALFSILTQHSKPLSHLPRVLFCRGQF